MKKQYLLKLMASALALAAVVAIPARATVFTLNVNSSLSSLTLSGNIVASGVTMALVQQRSGALVDFWGGTIVADLTAGVWTFGGGSTITALLNPVAAPPNAPFSISPNPTPIGTMVDNYGAKVSGLFGAVTGNAALRDMVVDIAAGTAVNGAASTAAFSFIGGTMLYGATALGTVYTGVDTMVGLGGANSSLGLVSWNGTTLNMPVKITSTTPNGTETFTGQIVAVLVPEPSVLSLLGVSLLGLAGVQFNRSRRSR